MSIVTEKRCAYCGENKPISQFCNNQKSKDGHGSWCKSCRKAYAVSYKNGFRKLPPSTKQVYLACIDCGIPKLTKRQQDTARCPKCATVKRMTPQVDGNRQCTKCGEIKPLSDFAVRKDTAGGYRGVCLVCDNIRSRQWRANNLEKSRTRSRDYYYKHHDEEKVSGREKRRQLRLEVLNAYGGKCACCGEATYEFLSIDHVDGDGHIERKVKPNTYSLLKKQGYPEGYRVLCHNCNQALGHYGYCPHNKLDNNQQPLWWKVKTQ